MTIEIRNDQPTPTLTLTRPAKDNPEDALFQQLVDQQDSKRDKAQANPNTPTTGENEAPSLETALAEPEADATPAGPTRTELDALDAEAAGLTVNGQPIEDIEGGATAALVGSGFNAEDDAALLTAVGAAERLVAEGAERNIAQPIAFARPGDGAAVTEKSTAAEALARVVSGGDAKPKSTTAPQPTTLADPVDQAAAQQVKPAPLKANVVEDAAPVVNKPNQTLAASSQAAAQRAQEVIAAARDLARGPSIDTQEPAIAQVKPEGASVQADAQARQQNQQPNGQALAQTAADKALAQQAAAQQAADKAQTQAAVRGAPSRVEAPAPTPQTPQNAQAQNGQQPSFANMLQQTAKTPEGAKTEQSGFQHQARAAHQSHAVADQVAVQIRKGFQGMDRISIQMKPAELGRVDVEMRLDNQGRIAIVVQADRPETVDMLQRESKTLEQALKDAGFDLSEGALSFGSRGEGRAFAGRSDLDALAQLGRDAETAPLEEASEQIVTASDALRRMTNPDAIDVVV